MTHFSLWKLYFLRWLLKTPGTYQRKTNTFIKGGALLKKLNSFLSILFFGDDIITIFKVQTQHLETVLIVNTNSFLCKL